MCAFSGTLAVLLHLRAREAETPGYGWTIACGVACALAVLARMEAALIFLALFADRLLLGLRRRDMGFLVFGFVFAALCFLVSAGAVQLLMRSRSRFPPPKSCPPQGIRQRNSPTTDS